MTRTTIGQYLIGAGELRQENRPIDPPAASEVQIAVRSTTLCGSDMHYFQNGRNGTIEVREPLCLGHEAAGEIIEAGKDAALQVGDRVAVECGVPCDDCDLCVTGRYNLCHQLRFRGSGSAWPHFQGTMQTRINHPARWTRVLPSNVSYNEGALLEPLSVAVHACNRLDMKQGSSVAIIGAGAIGLLCALAARRSGCRHIAITDIVEDRVQFALENTYADVGRVASGQRSNTLEDSLNMAKSDAEAVAKLKLPGGALFGPADYTFECTGVESCVQAAVFATKAGGKVALVGMGTPNVTLPVSVASTKEVDVVPIWRYANCYAQAMEIVAATKGDKSLPQLERMITHRFSGIDNVREALQTACLGHDSGGKMVVKVVLTNDV